MTNFQESRSTVQGSLQTDAVSQPPPRPDRITKWLLIAIGIYSALLVNQVTRETRWEPLQIQKCGTAFGDGGSDQDLVRNGGELDD